MYYVDNKTGVSTMPDIPPSESAVPQWFTEGGPGEEPTIPGSTTWNIWQAELLNILAAADVVPDKFKLNQIAESIGIMIANGIENAELLPGISYKPRTDSLNTQERAVEIISNKDMNTCRAGEFGLYEKATCANSPPSAGAYFYCETKACSHTFILTQFASGYDNNGGVMAWRNISASASPSGSEWCEVYDTHHKPTPDEIGAAPTNHTHDWGQVGAPTRVAGAYGEIVPGGEYAQLLSQSGFFNNDGGLGAYGDPFPGQWAYLFHNSHGNGAGFCGTLAMNFGGTQLRYGAISGGVGVGWKIIFTQDEPPQIGHIPGLQGALDSKAPAVHTHTAAQGNADVVAGGVGQIGTYGFFFTQASDAYGPGTTLPGSSLRWSSTDMHESDWGGGSPAGTWKLMGYYPSSAWTKSLWMRIA